MNCMSDNCVGRQRVTAPAFVPSPLRPSKNSVRQRSANGLAILLFSGQSVGKSLLERLKIYMNIMDVIQPQDDDQTIPQRSAPVILPHNPACGLVTEGPCNFYPRHKMPSSHPMNISTMCIGRKPNCPKCLAKLERN